MPCLHTPHPAAHVSIWNSCNTYLCYRARQAAASVQILPRSCGSKVIRTGKKRAITFAFVSACCDTLL